MFGWKGTPTPKALLSFDVDRGIVNASSTVLRVPDTPLVPAAVFVAPERVGSCSDIEIDATASTGGGGRGWTIAAWSVNCSTLPPANLTALRSSVAALGAGSDELEVFLTYLAFERCGVYSGKFV